MSVQVDSDALGTGLAKVAWVALLIAPILDMHAGLHALPRLLQGGLAVSCGAFFIAKMIRFPRWNDELANIKKFLRAIAALLAVVVVENFCTWCVLLWPAPTTTTTTLGVLGGCMWGCAWVPLSAFEPRGGASLLPPQRCLAGELPTTIPLSIGGASGACLQCTMLAGSLSSTSPPRCPSL